MRKLLWGIMLTVSVILLLWVGLSWFEVACKNLEPNPTYSAFNLFKMMLGATM